MKKRHNQLISKEDNQEFLQMGAMIASLRESAGISQSEAAIRASISRNTAYRIETGDSGVSVGVLMRYAKVIMPSFSLGLLSNWVKESHATLQGQPKTISTKNNPEYDF